MAGLYLHIPFCHKACVYCDFHFTTSLRYKERLLEAMHMELRNRSSESADLFNTIYFGGGTPSMLNPHELRAFLETIQDHFNVLDEAEITIEANPEDIDEQVVKGWIDAGINRVSLGVQSFVDEDLVWMNRGHTAAQSLNAIEILQSVGIQNISADLIFGLPNQSLTDWEDNVKKIIETNVPHVSLYNLTVEPKTELAHLVKNKGLKVGTEDLAAEQFAKSQQLLKSAGFEQYEISNYAKKGYVSKHNSSYWHDVNYCGIGPSAHSFNGKVRRWNIANNQTYMKGLESGSSYWDAETLTKIDRYNEYILTGLRTKWGIDLSYAEREFGAKLDSNKYLKEQIDLGYVKIEGTTAKLSESGMLFADRIALNLFMD